MRISRCSKLASLVPGGGICSHLLGFFFAISSGDWIHASLSLSLSRAVAAPAPAAVRHSVLVRDGYVPSNFVGRQRATARSLVRTGVLALTVVAWDSRRPSPVRRQAGMHDRAWGLEWEREGGGSWRAMQEM